MSKYRRCGLAAAVVTFGAHGAWAQDTAALEKLIVGKWAVSGTTNCLQSSKGFNDDMTPVIPLAPAATTFVSQSSGTFIGTRTFDANGRGSSDGISHSLSFPGTFHGEQPNLQDPANRLFFSGVGSTPPVGGASLATLKADFTWKIETDGTLQIDDDMPIVQPIAAPISRLDWTVTIVGMPPFVGYISKDRKTIVMTHLGMSTETSTLRDTSGTVRNSTPRFCTRHRVLTRLD